MQRYFPLRMILWAILLIIVGFLAVSTAFGSPASAYSSALRRYPYLTDVIGPYATINWATDRSDTSGAVRYGQVGSESCTAHYVPAIKTPISVNGVLQYQWKALLNLVPGTQYCYRVYLGSSPTNEVDLLGSDPAPSFSTQVPGGSTQPYSFLVFGDWGQVDASGNNSYQASLMSLMASSGARFAVTTGDNGYPSGTQKNLGDLIQKGDGISAIFGPSFWKVPGASLPIFPILGNHGFSSPDASHPQLVTWPQDRAVSTSGGRYQKETYCCLDGTTSKSYPSAWYAFDVGPARFYLLHAAWDEVNIGTASEYQVDYDYHWAPGTPQWEWLKADLAAHPSVLKFAFLHYPLYSDNPFESTDTYLLGSSRLEGLLKDNGVDIAFTGHAHIYERNFASANGVINYITGGGGATIGTLGTCTPLDAYAIKFTSSGKACGSAPVPTSQGQVFHFLKVTVNGTSVNVTPINALGQAFDVQNYSFTAGAETTPPSTPTNLLATAASGTQINLTWSASTDNTGIRGYGVYRNGVLIATVGRNTLTYSDTNLAIATGYSYQVDAFDGSGNHSAASAVSSATTPTTATYTINPVADAYVAGDFAATNYGRSTTLKVDASPDYRSYLRFNVSDITGIVTKATLRLYATSSSATGYQVKRVLTQSWEEGKLTYTSAPAPGALLGSSGSFSSGAYISVDVTSHITGNGVYDLALTTSSATALNFSSRDAASNRPQLVIETSTTPNPPTPTSTVGPTATFTPTTGPGSALTFTAAADARVVQASPTTNYGTATTLQADGDTGAVQTSFIRFTTSGISGPIQSVKLRVFCTTNGTANGPAAYLANSTWTESGTGGVTWNTQPSLLSSAVDNKGAIAVSTWVEYDVTSLVTGNGTYTLALVADGNDGIVFSSREGTTPPQLVITLGTAAPTATVGSGSTLTFAPVADTRVAEAFPTTNYGIQTNLQASAAAGSSQNSYIRFTISGISGPIQSARLRVYCTTNATNNGPASYLASSSWIESGTGGVTWSNKPPLQSAATDNKGAIAASTWVEYDVTSVITGNGTFTIALIGDGSDGVTFSSREGTNPPQLVITIGAGAALAAGASEVTPTTTPLATDTLAPTSTATSTPTTAPAATDTPMPTATSTVPAPENTVTPTAGLPLNALTFTTDADARVAQAFATTNYGAQTNLQASAAAGAAQNSYIRFTVSGISGTIQSVKLRVYCTTNGTADGPASYLADNNWIEKGTGGVTWDTQPALLSGASDNKGAIGLDSWVEYDVTPLVTGDGTYTFALVGDGSDGVTFTSREAGTNIPQLVVTLGP